MKTDQVPKFFRVGNYQVLSPIKAIVYLKHGASVRTAPGSEVELVAVEASASGKKRWVTQEVRALEASASP